mmetsp:Transcript_3188/g.4862  ORF Transcript_3188/g.4862 Transcript_3188/m.4862 type:complete len:164 (+) Transcript_3188:559-1050(+)
MLDPQPHKKPSPTEQEEARRGFFEVIDWQLFFNKMQEIVIVNSLKVGKLDAKLTSCRFLTKLNGQSTDHRSSADLFVDIDEQIFSAMFTEVEGLIKQLNEDLEPFCLQLSIEGESQIVIYLQGILVRQIELLYLIRQRAPLFQFDDNKEREYKLFMAKLLDSD